MQRRKRVDPRVIGSFVVGAVILSVAALLFFGPGGFLSETRRYVIYFDSSVKGLNVGSPVRFRGVKIGQVRDINVRVRTSDFKFNIPVTIEIEPSRIEAQGSSQGLIEVFKTTFQVDDPMHSLVDKGLRAQLQLDSLVTGQLYVNFDMHSEAPLTLTGNPSQYPELPSMHSSLDEITKTFEDLPLKELSKKLIHATEGIDKLVNSDSLHGALAQTDATMTNLNQLMGTLNKQLPEVMSEFSSTLKQAQSTMKRLDTRINTLADGMDETLTRVNARIDPVADETLQTLTRLKGAAANAEQIMEQLEQLSGDDSPVLLQLGATLREVNQAAGEARSLINELDRDPQILLRGYSRGE